MRDDGFTLIETLAALAVFSIAALSVLHLSDENTRTARFVEQRALAGIIADNRLAEIQISDTPLKIGKDGGEATIAGQAMEWRQEVRQTSQAGMLEVIVESGLASSPEAPFVRLVDRRLFVEASG